MEFVFRWLDRVIVTLGFLVVSGVIFLLGFNASEFWQDLTHKFIQSVAGIFFLQELYRFVSFQNKWNYLRSRWLDTLLSFSIFFCFLYYSGLTGHDLSEASATYILSAVLFVGLFSAMVNKVERRVTQSKLSLRPAQVFALSFVIPIIVGSCLLKMPNSAKIDIAWVDAIFMATSALCVTGLSVMSLESLTLLGQVILLILIQIGGLGIMTLSLAFASFVAGGLGLKDRLMISQMLSDSRLGEVKKLLFKICAFTFSIEILGIAALYFSHVEDPRELSLSVLWSSVFHGISAFCNAGFSIFQEGLSHVAFRENYYYNGTVMALIMLGGVGFPVLVNLQQSLFGLFRKSKERRWVSTHTRMVLTASLLLWGGGTCLFWISEQGKSMAQLGLPEQLFQSMFWAVTARTAGFNVLPVEALSIFGVFVLIFLMWIGGAPMSTAGGVKVTTFYVGVLNFWAQLTGKDRIVAFGREIGSESVHKAFAVAVTSSFLIFVSSLGIILLEPHLNPVDVLCEVVSAISTVGLTRGLTTGLSEYSKMILIFLMFVGRIGLITFFATFVRPTQPLKYKLLKDEVMIL